MHFSSALSLLACMASGVLSSPAQITQAPRAASCSEYVTTTTVLYTAHVCPDICVEPGSPLCPHLFCPAVPSCPTGSTITLPPAPAPTESIGNTTVGCTVTVDAEQGCRLCGCVGCPRCVAES